MSVQTVHSFLSSAKTDAELAAKVRGLQGNRQTAVAGLVEVAGQAGFAFTAEHYETVVREHFAAEHAAPLVGPEEVASLWAARRSGDDEKELSYDGTCSWYSCQGTGDHCGEEKTVNTDPQTGCW